MKKISILYTLITLVGVLFFYSCSDTEYPETRLFSPVLNQGLSAHLNTITVDLANLKDATSYKIEISRDTFKTPGKIKVYNFTENKAIITDLLYNTTYQVRATALSATEGFNSKVSNLGGVKTERFPSDLNVAKKEDIIDFAARISWTVNPKSEPITTVKVFAKDDEELLNPIASYETTDAEKLTGIKIINNLDPNTKYQLAIYSGNTVKGWDFYTTLPALVVGPNDIDLRDQPVVNGTLTTALAAAGPGGVVILDPLQTYPVGSTYFFDKALTIRSGYTLENNTGATISNVASGSTLELAENANIDKIIFDGVSFIGTSNDRIAFNVGTATSATLGELRFVNCKITSYRDLVRLRKQWATGGIQLLTVDNCILTNFGKDAVVLVEEAATVGSINPMTTMVFKNSTFSNVIKLTNHKSKVDTASLTISDCTFSEAPIGGGILIDYISGTNISGGITIRNTIFGGAVSGNTAYSFIKTGSLNTTTISSSNTYKTSDITFTPPTAPATTAVPSFTSYSGTTAALWVDPAKGNFNFKDATFAGSKTAGDPRWRK